MLQLKKLLASLDIRCQINTSGIREDNSFSKILGNGSHEPLLHAETAHYQNATTRGITFACMARTEKSKRNLYDHIMDFNRKLEFTGKLPDGIRIMNPFRENEGVLHTVDQFYRKYYSDNMPRKLILGINPGRLGAGSTGIPFTDPKRLKEKCGIEPAGEITHEPSSVFIYQLIEAYGGVAEFYSDYLISSICPLGFLEFKNGKWINHNYYDSAQLQKAITPFAKEKLIQLTKFGILKKDVYCLGTGKNYNYINRINEELQLFDRVIPLEHPRYIMQYKSSSIRQYIDKYLRVLRQETDQFPI
jgi:hypothetical protein